MDPLTTCDSRYRSVEQEFRLRSFTRLDVKAVGTDQTSNPTLAVTFEEDAGVRYGAALNKSDARLRSGG